ncbi:unnamed protein product [Cylindrotheca closterium]|uniref:Pop1 N-terminal domain-containing protein n=1 Tax=Cylindrotheca closterium TaxID=2856 RepID=A0AAD2CL08_9STRA|nr:unnamed protein product [Cylindrotheca closterium]
MSENPGSAVRSFRKRKRSSRPSWKDLPAFLDISSTVSVSLFASRRLPELRDLHAQLRTAANGQSSAQDRHGSSVNSKPSQVQPEVALRSGGAKTSSRHLRRRTTAVERKKHKHRFPKGNQPSSQSTTRKAKRGRRSTLCQGHFEWQHNALPVKKKEATTHVTNWMVTHLWHAKRFHMETLWGWRVPLCHSNRGGRAMLRLEQENRCSLQDVTWKRQTLAISSDLPLSSLVPLLSRMCPDFGTNQSALAGIQIGSGMLHRLDQFPMQAIGPVRWKVSCQNEAKTYRWMVQFLVHPSIYADFSDNIEQIMTEESNIQLEESSNMIGNSCFQLCGSSATNIIRNVLQPTHVRDTAASTCWDWSKVPDEQVPETCLPHGSMFHVTLHLDGNSQGSKTPSLEGLRVHVTQMQRSIEQMNLKKGDGEIMVSKIGPNQALLIWQAPRELNCLPNQAVSGWEIHCSDPTLAKAVWMKLVLAGPCCPMGMVEESHLKLECSPPIPMFPRDYVDTPQGQLYWKGNTKGPSTAASKAEGTEPSGNLVRRLWEGGWGRLSIKTTSVKMCRIYWSRLVSHEDSEEDEKFSQKKEDDQSSIQQEQGMNEDGKDDTESDDDTSTVVVRGAFVQPFVQALQGCGQQPPESSGQNEASVGTHKLRKRNRRRAKPLNDVLKAPPLSKQNSEAWKQSCFGLRSSLSLPAMLVCHVQVAGKGAMQPGDEVRFESIRLGYITIASFSLGRGTCHGISVVGAARLLHALESSSSNSGRHVRSPDSSRSLQLAVTVRAGDTHCQGSLSIM